MSAAKKKLRENCKPANSYLENTKFPPHSCAVRRGIKSALRIGSTKTTPNLGIHCAHRYALCERCYEVHFRILLAGSIIVFEPADVRSKMIVNPIEKFPVEARPS